MTPTEWLADHIRRYYPSAVRPRRRRRVHSDRSKRQELSVRADEMQLSLSLDEG